MHGCTNATSGDLDHLKMITYLVRLVLFATRCVLYIKRNLNLNNCTFDNTIYILSQSLFQQHILPIKKPTKVGLFISLFMHYLKKKVASLRGFEPLLPP